MAFEVMMTFKRPNESIKWHTEHFITPMLTIPYRQANAENAVDRTILELDPLTLEITQRWESEEKFNDYYNITAIRHQTGLFDEYNKSNGISKRVIKTLDGNIISARTQY